MECGKGCGKIGGPESGKYCEGGEGRNKNVRQARQESRRGVLYAVAAEASVMDKIPGS